MDKMMWQSKQRGAKTTGASVKRECGRMWQTGVTGQRPVRGRVLNEGGRDWWARRPEMQAGTQPLGAFSQVEESPDVIPRKGKLLLHF